MEYCDRSVAVAAVECFAGALQRYALTGADDFISVRVSAVCVCVLMVEMQCESGVERRRLAAGQLRFVCVPSFAVCVCACCVLMFSSSWGVLWDGWLRQCGLN